MLLIKIKGKKLKELRGSRSLASIAELSGKQFTDVALMKWESEARNPKQENIETLLRIYNCNLEDIAEPMELAMSK